MANEQDNEREQILAHFQKLDDAAGDRSPFLAREEESANVADSNPAPSPEPEKNDEPKGDEPAGESHEAPKGEEPKGEEPKSEEPKGEAPKGEEPKGEQADPQESKYKKAQRGRERLEDIRKQAEADKAEARRLKEEAEKRHAEVKALIDQAVSQRRPQQQTDVTEGGRFTAEEFERAADWHATEAEKAVEAGDLEKYHEHATNAKTLRRASRQVVIQQQQEQQRKAAADFARTYGEHAERIIKDNPDLGIESELSGKMQQLLQEQPILTMIPDGFAKAWEILQLREQAGKAAGLLETNKQLQAEVDRLRKLTSLETGDNSPISPTTDIEKLPLEKQREHFRRQMEKADGF